MRIMRKSILLIAFTVLASDWSGTSPAAAAEVAIGTGEPGSPYHQLGRALCRLIDSGSDEHGLTCEPLITPAPGVAAGPAARSRLALASRSHCAPAAMPDITSPHVIRLTNDFI